MLKNMFMHQLVQFMEKIKTWLMKIQNYLLYQHIQSHH